MRKFLLASVGLLAAAFAAAPSSLVLPGIDYVPMHGGYFARSRATGGMVRMQSHTGAGGRGAHRRWKKRRAAGRY